MNNVNDNRSYSGLVEKYIGTAYDKVAAVADNLEYLIKLGELLKSGISFGELIHFDLIIEDDAGNGTISSDTDHTDFYGYEIAEGNSYIDLKTFHVGVLHHKGYTYLWIGNPSTRLGLDGDMTNDGQYLLTGGNSTGNGDIGDGDGDGNGEETLVPDLIGRVPDLQLVIGESMPFIEVSTDFAPFPVILEYRLIGAPAWMNINPTTGRISGVPQDVVTTPGIYVEAINDAGSTSTNIFTSVVEDSPIPSNIPVLPSGSTLEYGMGITAGSGRHLAVPKTNVYHITSIADYHPGRGNPESDNYIPSETPIPGTLRYSLEADSDGIAYVECPKTIIFDVSGTIILKAPISVGKTLTGYTYTKRYITVAGQTAPSPGITLRNHGITVPRNAHDILIQHIRIRTGDTTFYDNGCDRIPPDPACIKSAISDPINLAANWIPAPGDGGPAHKPCHGIVVNHCSFSWGGDMNFLSGGNNVTVSHCISSEALDNPLHPKGPHSKGMAFLGHISNKFPEAIEQYSQYVLCERNLITHCEDRNPLAQGGRVVIANNVMYDTGQPATISLGDHSNDTPYIKSSVVGNYTIDTKLQKFPIYGVFGPAPKPGTKIYIGPNNRLRGEVQLDPWGINDPRIIKMCINWGACTGKVEDYPWMIANTPEEAAWPTNYQTLDVNNTLAYVLANAGARPTDRDPVDTRIVEEVAIAEDPWQARWRTHLSNGDPIKGELKLQQSVNEMRISKLDFDGVDRSAELGKLQIGMEIQGATFISWLITSISVSADFYTFGLNSDIQLPNESKRIMSFQMESKIIKSQSEVGGWPTLAFNIDSHNNMPSNPDLVMPSGYTALEEWLHSRSLAVES